MRTLGRPHSRLEAGPNLTALVDVALVLLIFLMLVGTFIANEHYLPLDLAAGAPTPSEALDEPLYIRIDPRHRPDECVVRIGSTELHNPADAAPAIQQWADAMRAVGVTDLRVVLAPAPRVRLQDIVTVRAGAINAKIDKISFATSR